MQKENKITLETIALEKEKKLKEIHNVQDNIRSISHNLLAPKKRKSGVEGIMQNISTGIAIFDGIRMGMKIMNRIQGAFKFKK